MLPNSSGSNRKQQRWWNPHLLPACTLCAGLLLGALLSSSGGRSGYSSTGQGLWAGADPKHRIVVFYHVYVANNWQETAVRQQCTRQGVVEDQAAKLLFSGLYHAASSIFCGVGAPAQDAALLATTLLQSFGKKFQVFATEIGGNSFERITLNGIRERTQPGDRIMYMHTKGVGAGAQSESGRRNVYVWRFMMEYFLIARWRECQRLLEKYDVVGTEYQKAGQVMTYKGPLNFSNHFSGNFWWTTAAHWHSLPPEIGDYYIDTEMFILSRNDTRWVQVWTSGLGPAALYGLANDVLYPATYAETTRLEPIPPA